MTGQMRLASVRREGEEFDQGETSGLWHDIECSSLRTEVDAMIEQVCVCVYVCVCTCVCMDGWMDGWMP